MVRMRLFIARLLSPLERFLKIDLRYTLSGGFFLGLTQVTSAIVAFGLTIAFANLLPVETYGTYRYVLAVYGLLAIASLPGVDTAVLQSISKGYDSAFVAGIRTKFRWGILGGLASAAYGGFLYLQGSMVMGHIFMLVAVALPFMEAFSLYTSVLNAKRKFRTWAAFEVLTQAISLTALVIAMALTKHIIVLMLAYFAPYIVCRIAATWYLLRTTITKSGTDAGMLVYGREMTLFQVIARLMSSLDQIVLYHFLGPAQVAIFSLATAVPNRIQSVFRITGTLAFPKFAERTGAEVAATLPRKMALFAFAILAICILYVLIAPVMFALLFPKYLPSLEYSQGAIFYTLSGITYPFGSYLLAHKRVFDNYLMAITSFIAKVICLIGLVPFFGIWGAIVGILATAATTIIVCGWIILRERANTGSE